MAHPEISSTVCWQCWSPRYNVSALFQCGGCDPERLIVVSLIKLSKLPKLYVKTSKSKKNKRYIYIYIYIYIYLHMYIMYIYIYTYIYIYMYRLQIINCTYCQKLYQKYLHLKLYFDSSLV